MNALLAFGWPFSETVVERLGWVLVHSLWQFALVALLTGAIVRAMRRSSSAARYGVLVVAMAVLVAVPLVTWLISPSDARDELASRVALAPGQETNAASSPRADATQLANNPVLAGDAEIEVPTPDLPPSSVVSKPLPAASPLSAGNTPPEPSWSLRAKTVLQPWLAWIVVGWSLGVVLCSARPLLGWHTLRRLKQEGVSPVSDEVLAALHRASERLGLRGSVQLLQSTLAQVPVVIGYVRPVILLPLSLMASLPAEQLEAILAHELAHVRRHDFVVNLLQTLVEMLFFYHPAVWWLSRQIRVEREHCCDDLVVASLGNRVEYGRALLAIEELRGRSTVLALGATDGLLLSRIRRIVGFNSDRAANSPWSVLCLVTSCLAAVFGVSVLGWNGLAETNRDESQTMLVVEWFAVVDDGLIQEIRALKPTTGKELPATGAETIRRSSDELRAIVKKHLGDPAQVLLSQHANMLPPSAPGFRPTGIAHTSGFAQHVTIGDRPVSVMHGGAGSYFVEERNDAAGVRLKMGYSFGVGSTQSGNVPVNLDADVKPGEAIVTMIGLKPGAEWQASMIAVHEAIRVPAHQVEFFKPLSRANDWFRFGPVGTKRRVARAAAWHSRAKRDVFSIDPDWTRKQPNGGHVQLVAISRPTKSPMVWWDPKGRPISGIDNYAFTSHADKDIVALVRVWEDGTRRNLLDDGSTRSGHGIRDLPDRSKTTAGSQLVVVPAVLVDDDGRPSLKLCAGFGAWTAEAELNSEENATATLGPLTITTSAGHEFKYFKAVNQLAVKTSTAFRWLITRELDLTVVAVTKDGNEVWPSSNPTIYANDPPNTVNSALFIEHPLAKADIDHFIVKSRPCHWTEFTGFATEPAEPLDPPLDFSKNDDE
ncbi:MAG: M56 family metallopeptidase, partial [Planctomycetaceae bacterium]|nr:M56 family metallopeptidase [Planctomycetaceae bacterium]